MEERTARFATALNQIGSILKDLWNEFENSGLCCGIRLDREIASRPSTMPTPGSCCGVRV